MRYSILLTAFIIFPIINSQAADFSVSEKNAIKAFEETDKRHVSEVNSDCGSNITMTQNWESFKGQDLINKDLTDSCTRPLDRLGELCRVNDIYKTAITSKIKEYKCVYGPEKAVQLKDGVVIIKVDPKDSEPDFAVEYFKSVL